MTSQPRLSVVIPCYNEEENIDVLYNRLIPVLKKTGMDYEILFVDDGSRDNTFVLVESLNAKDFSVRGISLSRNFGHQVALSAGLHNACGELVITMDGDLQHPPELIPKLIAKYNSGAEIVNTRRMETADAGFVKRRTSRFFYRLVNHISKVHIEDGAADFRLMSRKAVDAYNAFTERDRFNRGLVAWMGFKQDVVDYSADRRNAGHTKYSFRRMIHFAIDGITSFSSRPLRMAAYAGVVVSLLGLLYALYAIIRHFCGATIQGWTSLLITVLLLGGVQLLSLGVIGEYIARIFNESKSRPLYFIKNKTADSSHE